jgi:di/tricarboxylate transporter
MKPWYLSEPVRITAYIILMVMVCVVGYFDITAAIETDMKVWRTR